MARASRTATTGDPAATAEAFGDGWLHTQDLGFLDGGELFVTGRKKDMVIIRGRNYYPQDIEWSIQDVDGIRRGNAVAFAYPDEQGVDRVVVVAEARGTDSLDSIPKEVAACVRAQLGIVVADIVVIERDTLPKTSSGKVRRAETKARYLARSLTVLASSLPRPVLASSRGPVPSSPGGRCLPPRRSRRGRPETRLAGRDERPASRDAARGSARRARDAGSRRPLGSGDARCEARVPRARLDDDDIGDRGDRVQGLGRIPHEQLTGLETVRQLISLIRLHVETLEDKGSVAACPSCQSTS